MRNGLTGQESRADPIDNADQVGKKATGPDKNGHAGEEENTAADKLAKKGRTSVARRTRQKWLREIAKTAASVRWQRGD